MQPKVNSKVTFTFQFRTTFWESIIHAGTKQTKSGLYLSLGLIRFQPWRKWYFKKNGKHLKNQPEKTADISRCHHWFPRKMTSEKRVQKFHTDDVWVLIVFLIGWKYVSSCQKHTLAPEVRSKPCFQYGWWSSREEPLVTQASNLISMREISSDFWTGSPIGCSHVRRECTI